MDPVQEVLEHHGVQGMKWGKHRAQAAAGSNRSQRKLNRADKKFARSAGSFNMMVKLHNAAAVESNKGIDAINNKPKYKGADFTRDTPLRRAYYKEHQDAFIKNLEKAANDLGENASGTKRYGILERPDGNWDVILRDVKHAEDDDALFNVKIKYDAKGHIVSIGSIDEPSSIALKQMESFDMDEFLEHYGKKGMKWGVRNDSNRPTGPAPVTFKPTKPGKFVKTSGGQRHPASEDAITAQIHRQKAKASTTDVLSNKELQALVTRMNLEQQYSNLKKKNDRSSLGFRVLKSIIRRNPNKTLEDVNKFSNSPQGKAIKTKLAAKAATRVAARAA